MRYLRTSYLVVLLSCAGFLCSKPAHAQQTATQTYKDCTITYSIGGGGLQAVAAVTVNCSQVHQLTASVHLTSSGEGGGGNSDTNSADGTSVAASTNTPTDGNAEATYSVEIDGNFLGDSLSE